ARRRQELTGRTFPTVYPSLGLLIVLPIAAAMVTGFPLSWEFPELTGFNFTGGIVVIPELMALL
ncbi:MAG: amino acid ABC transporter permease, partial [Deltaproteobacteria bacterium]|nr:amino acid ABC transporter permease [Deltaproteobacteria bacterium]